MGNQPAVLQLFPRANLGEYSSHGQAHAPNTGLAVHDTRVICYAVKMLKRHSFLLHLSIYNILPPLSRLTMAVDTLNASKKLANGITPVLGWLTHNSGITSYRSLLLS
jgi:hypothetical protein